MIVKAIVTQIGKEVEKTSERTGEKYKIMPVKLEWTESERTNRIWIQLFSEKIEEFNSEKIAVGDTCEVDLKFSAWNYRTGYGKTDVKIESIKKV